MVKPLGGNYMKKLLISAAVVACVTTSAMAASLSDQFGSIAIFGDSLSDNGNLFALTGNPPAPYSNGRFSNGPVWNEGIVAEIGGSLGGVGVLGVPSSNFAFGGARADLDLNAEGPIPSLLEQVGAFALGGNSFAPDTLASVWAGANDIFQDIEVGNGTAVGENTAVDVATGIGGLISFGARNILVFNLPDIGATPAYDMNPLQSDATDATIAFNTDLGAAVDAFQLLDPTLNIIEVDVFTIFNDIIGNPAAFGVGNAEDACIFTISCILGDTATQNAFLFWDGVHPTTTGHQLIEAAARAALAPSAVPLPAAAPLYLLAFAGFGLIARRRS